VRKTGVQCPKFQDQIKREDEKREQEQNKGLNFFYHLNWSQRSFTSRYRFALPVPSLDYALYSSHKDQPPREKPPITKYKNLVSKQNSNPWCIGAYTHLYCQFDPWSQFLNSLMHHFQAAIFEVDTGEIWYKVCKDSQQRHKQGKAEIVPHVLCMIKVEYMITFLNRALKNEITHLLLIDTNQGYTSHCVASWIAWDGVYVLIKHCITCGSSKAPEVHSYFPIAHITWLAVFAATTFPLILLPIASPITLQD